jgi:hypothetical protein
MCTVSEPAESDELARLLEPLDRGDPISDDALRHLTDHVQETYGATIPDDHVSFLRLANGAAGELPGGNAIDLGTQEQVPGFFVIGSDSGDIIYEIDLRADALPERYVETEDVGMDWDYILWRGSSFLELVRYSATEN